MKGTGFKAEEKLLLLGEKCQGTTLVVPQMQQNKRGL
jgi:hypothetical protein